MAWLLTAFETAICASRAMPKGRLKRAAFQLGKNVGKFFYAKRFFVLSGKGWHPGTFLWYSKFVMKKELIKIQSMIYEIRGQKVMLDSDLAALYEVETFNLNKAVKRNIERFPCDFMFQLTKEEWEDLTFQNGISSKRHGGRRFMPYAFTEQGVAMLAAVLNSQKAIDVNISIMRTFVKLRQYVFSKNDTNEQIAELRKLLMLYIEKNDKRVNDIIIALNNLIEQPRETKTIGFNTGKGKK